MTPAVVKRVELLLFSSVVKKLPLDLKIPVKLKKRKGGGREKKGWGKRERRGGREIMR